MSHSARADRQPVGRVAVLGAHILDVLGWPVDSIPPGQGSARLTEIRRALLIGAPDALGGLVEDGLAEVIAAAKAGGALIAVDVLRQGSTRDFARIAALLALADWFAPNADQLAALTGEDDIFAAINKVLSLGTGGVAVTLGAEGALVASRDGGDPVHVPAIAVDVVDTTGCGDGFNAGLVTGLLAGASPADAAWLGVACGALVATGLGSDAGITDLDQVLGFLGATAPGPAERLRAALAGSGVPAGKGP